MVRARCSLVDKPVFNAPLLTHILTACRQHVNPMVVQSHGRPTFAFIRALRRVAAKRESFSQAFPALALLVLMC